MAVREEKKKFCKIENIKHEQRSCPHQSMDTIYTFFITALLAKSAGGDAIAAVDILLYMFTSASSLFPAVLYYILPLQPMFLVSSA